MLSAAALRKLEDKMNSHLRAIRTLATTDQILDGFLINIVSSKLDSRALKRWEEELSSNILSTWTSMSSFLEKRCRLLENLNSALSSHLGRQSHKHNQSVLIAASTNSNKTLCNFCEEKDHYLPKCTRFLNLSPSLRYKEAKKFHLCFNFLRNDMNMNMKHYTLLNFSHAPLPSSSSGSLDPSSKASTLIAWSSTSPYPPPIINSTQYPDQYVLLATAVVFVKNRAGSFIPCRAILDSASQLNFVSSRFAGQLQLKSRPPHVSLSGIGESSLNSEKAAYIIVQSQYYRLSAAL